MYKINQGSQKNLHYLLKLHKIDMASQKTFYYIWKLYKVKWAKPNHQNGVKKIYPWKLARMIKANERKVTCHFGPIPVRTLSFWSYSLSVRSFWPGSFWPDFRGGSFWPNVGRSFRPTYILLSLFYMDFSVLKDFLSSLDWFYAVLIDDKSFSGFLDLFNAVYKDNNSLFSFCSDLIT